MRFKRFTFQFLVLWSFAFIFPRAAQLNPSASVWDVMRSEFKLDHQLTRPEVQRQLRWLIAHPGYFNSFAQAKPYLYHIVTEIKKRNLPGEIALIPMIESAYDPFAYSSAGAAGLWQIMPHTGKDLGLKRDWWTDGRRSITPSTNAALNYLNYLHHFFQGNWDLAIAAYDAGEGTVSSAMKKNHRSGKYAQFWSLPLPQETQNYVPRLLALAEIISHPERYHLQLPSIQHTPYFTEIDLKSPIDLNHAAKLADMSYQELLKLNPGVNHWSTTPGKPFKLLIPTQKVERFTRNLAMSTKEERSSLTHHRVKTGETINSIAKQHSTTISLLRNLNQLHNDHVKPGQVLLIPVNGNHHQSQAARKTTTKLPQNIKVIHIVQNHETLEHIARKYNTSSVQIRRWNHLHQFSQLTKGKQLIIWRKT